ncbi:outer membrane protein assembly factor BamA [Primorskyibacter sp. 2E107]
MFKANQVSNASKAVAVAIALGVGVGAVTLPQRAVAQAYSFSSVSIEGNRRIEGSTILSYAGIARGQRVTAAELNDAYQKIVASGLFESVEIIPQGATLVIRVVEYPTVNRINFEGNKRLKDDDLAEIVQSQSRRVFSPRQAEADAQAISEAYAVQGRIAARVTPKVIKRSNNRVDLAFEIFEGGVSEIERIGFAGNGTYSDRRLRRVLETKQAGLLRALIKKDTFIEDRIEFDKQLLNDFYASRGYVDFRVTGVNAELAEERDGYFVTFNVEEGQQFNVGEVTVTSDLSDVDPDVFQRVVKLRSGATYSPSKVENEIARLERLAIDEGLNFVRVEPRITRNDRDLTLDVELMLTRGERIFVERIDIEGNTTTLDRVVREQFDVAEGDPFNPRAIRESAERIRALGYFDNADVEAREGSSPNQVIVDVNVEEKPTGALSFGGSYSTTDGFGASISFSERNFLGRGQQFSFAVQTAASANRYSLGFVEPRFLGRDVAFGLNLSYSETDVLSSAYTSADGIFQPSLTFPVSDNGRLQLRYTLRYSDMRDLDTTTVIGHPDLDGTPSTGLEVAREAGLEERWDSSIGYTYSYDTRRTGLNPNAGVLLEFGQDFGGLGGDSTFIRTKAKAVAQTKVFNEEVTLRASIEGGALSYSKGSSRVNDRFVTGPNLMRGFEYGGIGPREYVGGTDVNDVLGGNYYAVASLEAEFPLGLPEEYGITGGVFYDIGSVWGYDNPTNNPNVLYSDFSARHVIGVSIFWDSFIGPLRLNFSEALKKEKEDIPLNFNLSISTEF